MSSNYPLGAENDPNAPWNEYYADLTVEVNVELGTFVNISVPVRGGERLSFNKEGILQDLVEEAIKEKLGIDNDDIILNNFEVCDYQ